ncbi:hypothetical protein [Ruminococcus sp.]|uniref:hypothetical protein n=1 Tax=Ruminococcus sp. TaxID=41978 RepID=UPI002E815C8C|nr:hypothetical protein [Ruminococcus sp.]MEE3440616.1 hypothetical protein [Ruminococcus sp.]
MFQCNIDIRQKAKESSVSLWEIADKLNISESTMTRKLRRELPTKEKDQLFSIIEKLAKEKAVE